MSKTDTINVLVIAPQEKPYTMTIENDFRAMQKVVEGDIEYVRLDEECHLYCNGEGKLDGLTGNRRLDSGDIICGTFFICAGDDEGNDISLTAEQIEKYSTRFSGLEFYSEVESGEYECMVRSFDSLQDLFGALGLPQNDSNNEDLER